MARLQRISPCLWFDGAAEEAATHYVGIFPNSRITKIARYGDAGPGNKGSVMVVGFELDGVAMSGLNGGPMFTFTEAISLVVHCADQGEVDHFWTRLSEGGQPSRCGWLKDRYGVSWQVVPVRLFDLMDAEPDAAGRVMAALLGMDKIVVADLEKAHRG